MEGVMIGAFVTCVARNQVRRVVGWKWVEEGKKVT